MRKLWLDLGNTRLKYWLTDQDGNVIKKAAELHLQAPAELLLGLVDSFTSFEPTFIGVSSVLGAENNAHVMQTLQRLNVPTQLVQVDANHSIMSSDYDANQLGIDRWLQMIAVADKSEKLCVVGCGTALTIDLIENRHHLGGYIFPSIYLQREALMSGTRQISIPEAEFASISAGQTTSDAVHRGILLSLVGAINDTLHRHPDYQLVMTGGDADTIAQYLHRDAHIEQDLVLKGLQQYFHH